MERIRELSDGRPFVGTKVYYSGSSKETPGMEQYFAWKLVQYMTEGGADVLSEHVAARSQDERNRIRARRMGVDINELQADPEPWFRNRRTNLRWIEEATHLIASVDAPSHGVGIELEHAILKPKLGLNVTPILCLVHVELLEKLSNMIRGVGIEECAEFYIKGYQDLKDAEQAIHDFLT